MRTLILGAQGQLGHELARVLSGDVVCLDRAAADLTRPDLLAAALAMHRPVIVYNAAAYNHVDRAEAEPEAAFAVNALGVRSLSLACRAHGCVLVHFSTDHVFGLDAGRQTPYAETDVPGPVNVYGASKLAGEQFVRTISPRHFVIRTCGLYGNRGTGGKGGNFVEAIRRRAAAGEPLRVVADQECSPTHAADLASAAAALAGTGAYGLYHITNARSCTWFEFASAILADAGGRVPLTAISSAEYGAAAARPSYSVLDGAKYLALGLPPLRPWQQALPDYLTER
jgi:dTDP-4-dehydrorhamnose reductase